MTKFFYEDIKSWNLDEFLNRKKTAKEVCYILELIKPILEGFEKRSSEENDKIFMILLRIMVLNWEKFFFLLELRHLAVKSLRRFLIL